MNGFFQLQRRFFDHWLWNGESRVFSKAEAFLDLLQLAAFTRTKRIVGTAVIHLEPGEVCGSERYLSGRWGWSTKKVRAFLTLLEADRMVGRQKKQGITVITLCNYGKYTKPASAQEAAKNHGGSSEEAARKRIEEGEEAEREQAKGRDGIPDAEAVKAYARSAPVPITEECAIGFFDQMVGDGWINRHGHPIADWRGTLRRYASHWNENEKSKGRKPGSNGAPRHKSTLGDDSNIEDL